MPPIHLLAGATVGNPCQPSTLWPSASPRPVRTRTTVRTAAGEHGGTSCGRQSAQLQVATAATSTGRGERLGHGSSGGASASGGGDKTVCDPGSVPRRQALLAAAAAAFISQGLPPPASAATAPATAPAAAAGAGPASFLQPLLPSPAADLLAQLEGRAPIYQPGVAWALRNKDRQLFYPAWMEGEWEVTARFAAASFPQGRRLLGRTVPGVLKGSMVMALPDVGAAMEGAVVYRARFVASPQEGGVVADRAFNVQQLMDAFYAAEVTRSADYAPLSNPTRMAIVYATPRRETSVISEDLRKAEIIINNRLSQTLSPTEFVSGELFRQITQASAQGFVGDYEIINKFSLKSAGGGAPTGGEGGIGAAATEASVPEVGPSGAGGGASVGPVVGLGARVRVLQRVAAFLQPQDAAYFEAGGQAVAAYDYTYDYVRVV